MADVLSWRDLGAAAHHTDALLLRHPVPRQPQRRPSFGAALPGGADDVDGGGAARPDDAAVVVEHCLFLHLFFLHLFFLHLFFSHLFCLHLFLRRVRRWWSTTWRARRSARPTRIQLTSPRQRPRPEACARGKGASLTPTTPKRPPREDRGSLRSPPALSSRGHRLRGRPSSRRRRRSPRCRPGSRRNSRACRADCRTVRTDAFSIHACLSAAASPVDGPRALRD
eukprot:SAG31_NODE_83_length_27039_cov_14.035746_13_plen_225_part_00